MHDMAPRVPRALAPSGRRLRQGEAAKGAKDVLDAGRAGRDDGEAKGHLLPIAGGSASQALWPCACGRSHSSLVKMHMESLAHYATEISRTGCESIE